MTDLRLVLLAAGLAATACVASDGPTASPVAVTDEESSAADPPGQDACQYAVNAACNTRRPDYSCFEHHVGHDGWVQEHVQNLDCPLGGYPSCDDPSQPYVISVVRMCHPGGAGQTAPCPGATTLTGKGGCAVCTVTSVTCD